MKAYVHTRYGPPEVLTLTDVPIPKIGDSEVLIKIHATTVNRTDDGLLRAKPFISRFFTGLISPRDKISGSEFSGTIESVGKNVSTFKPGDRVFGHSEFGAHAEYLKISADGPIANMPENMTFEQAAALSEGAHYALNYIRRVPIESGHKVLLNGATGAIGSAGLQIIKAIGAEVTAVCATEHVALVSSLGADHVIDYKKEDFTKIDTKFNTVFDAVGKSRYRSCKPLLVKGGTYASTELGPYSQNPILALITPLYGDKKVLFPIPVCNQEIITYLKDLAANGKFTPVIDRYYPFEQLAEAFDYVHTGMKTGNVIIRVR